MKYIYINIIMMNLIKESSTEYRDLYSIDDNFFLINNIYI